MSTQPKPPLFPLGRVLATPAALDALRRSGETPQTLIERHARGDWGAVGPEDAALNDRAVVEGARILSVYPAANRDTVWVISEADRSATTLLLASEY